MYQASNQFVSKLDTSPMKARLTFSDGNVIPSGNGQDPILGFTFSGGSSVAAIGCAVSVGVSVELDRSLLSATSFSNKMVTLDLSLEGLSEWIPMGEFHVIDAPKSDATVTLKLQDALGTVFDKPYEPITGYDFTQGVNNISFLRALCARRGVSVNTSGLTSFTLKDGDPTGCSERSIIASIAGLAGKFACMDRSGTLCFRWYQASGASIGPDDYYDEECITGDTFTASYLKCYNSTLAETLVQGDSTGTQGLSMDCMWCTPARLARLWQALGGFSYTTIRNLQMLGNPLLDLGDIVQVTDYGGNRYSVPIVSIYHEYDGGMITMLSAPMEDTEGSTAGEMRRFKAQITKRVDDLGASILLEVAGTYATKEDLTGLAKTTEVTALIKTAVDDSSASILQQVSGTYATKNEISGFVTQTQVDASIKTAVDANGSSILQTVSGTYATKNEISGFVTQTQVDASIKTAVDANGSSILQAVSATYATQEGLKSAEAKLELKVNTKDLVSEINAVANKITITSNNFTLTADGRITAKSGLLGGWSIEDGILLSKADNATIWLAPKGIGEQFSVGETLASDWLLLVANATGASGVADVGIKGDGQFCARNAYLLDAFIDTAVIEDANIRFGSVGNRHFSLTYENGFSVYDAQEKLLAKIYPQSGGQCIMAYGTSGRSAGLGALAEPLFFAPVLNGSTASGLDGLRICWRTITVNDTPISVLSAY